MYSQWMGVAWAVRRKLASGSELLGQESVMGEVQREHLDDFGRNLH